MTRVALTQSAGKLADLEALLRSRGFAVERSPLIATKPLLDASTKARAAELLDCAWLLFTSPAGVAAWGELGLGFGGSGFGGSGFGGRRLGAVGQKTASALTKLGARAALLGEPPSAAGLTEAFLQHPQASSVVGLPRGDRALSVLEDELVRHGFETRSAVVYRTVPLSWSGGQPDVVVLSSPSAAEALPAEVAKAAKLIALGPSTGRVLAEYGYPYAQAARPEAAAVLAAIEQRAEGF